MKKILGALAVVMAASTGVALADSMSGPTMLQVGAENDLIRLGVTGVDADMLTLNQASLIKAITASSGYGRNEKVNQVRAILGTH
jgi:hypothetical protein